MHWYWLHIDAHLLNKTHPVAMVSAMISGFSLCVIPGGGTDRCIATVKVKTKAGKEKEYVFEDGVTTIAWVPFILAVPFNRPWAALPETRKNIWRHLIAAMRKDGLVP